jgi:PKD repeat protein
MKKTILSLSMLALAASAAAQTLIVPSVAAAADGNSSTGYPLDIANGRLIYIYDSTHFTSNGVNFPILISQISYRANSSTAQTWAGGSMSFSMDLSTAPIDYSAVSTTWTANHGLDQTQVFNGTLTIPAGSSAVGSPGPFYATVTFSQPFLYDPSLGDLTIDTMTIGNTIANTPSHDSVSTTGTALARRAYSLTNPPAATATVASGEVANVLEFTYTPASGLYAGFTADVTSGASPLTVNFTDHTFTSDPNGITSWAWDFDGDNVVDSTLQNPTFVYTTCGTFNVSLTVTDGTHPPSTHTKTAYVTTDIITANFTDQVIGPLMVQFTDTSNMPATSWAWDLDGDNVTDSTLPNPIWVYTSTNAVNVTLTVARNCSSPSTITKSIVPMQRISQNVVAGNGLSSGSTVFYDLNITNPTGVNVSGFDVIVGTTNTAFTIDVFVTPGTYQGVERTAAVWTKVATATGTPAASTTVLTPATLAQPFYLPPGSYGVAMQYIGVGSRYAGTTTGGPLTTVTNGDLSLTVGASLSSTVAAPFTGTSLFSPRLWSGVLYYGTNNVTGQAGYGFFAPGCAGSLGVSHQSSNLPQMGGTLTVTLDSLPMSLAIMMTGFSNTFSPFGPLPLDLTTFGAPGCFGRVSPDTTALLLGAGNSASWSFAVPNAFQGLILYSQALVLDPGFNGLGAVVSDAAAMQFGL